MSKQKKGLLKIIMRIIRVEFSLGVYNNLLDARVGLKYLDILSFFIYFILILTFNGQFCNCNVMTYCNIFSYRVSQKKGSHV